MLIARVGNLLLFAPASCRPIVSRMLNAHDGRGLTSTFDLKLAEELATMESKKERGGEEELSQSHALSSIEMRCALPDSKTFIYEEMLV